jgi:hypothetical protein
MEQFGLVPSAVVTGLSLGAGPQVVSTYGFISIELSYRSVSFQVDKGADG